MSEPVAAIRMTPELAVGTLHRALAAGNPAELFEPLRIEAWRYLRGHERPTFDAMLADLEPGQRAVLFRRLGPDEEPIGAGPLPGFTPSDVFEEPSASRYIVKGVLEPSELVVVFGESGAMKSFWVLDLALHVSAGLPYGGRNTNQAGVLYVAGEGGTALRRRVRAWLIRRGYQRDWVPPSMFVATQPANLMFESSTVSVTIAAAEAAIGCRVGVVVFDTLAANFGPGDESKTEDVHRALAEARAACGDRAIVLVHHVGHNQKDRERGAYALRGAADRRYLIERPQDGPLVTVRNLKAKDGAPIEPLAFEWRVVELGWRDCDGDMLTSLVLDPTDKAPPPPAEREPIGKVQRAIVSALKRNGSMSRSDLVRAVEDDGGNRQAAYKALRLMAERGIVVEGLNKLALVESVE